MILDKSQFANAKEIRAYLSKYGADILAAKRASMKYADGCGGYILDMKTGSDKSEPDAPAADPNRMNRKCVINTTNLFDSHEDVHINGLWDKDLSKSAERDLLQEHKNSFANVIAHGVKAYTQDMDFADLGVGFSGKTQALIFDADLERGDNPLMFEKYEKGRVKQHSVGMRYVKLCLAIDDKDEKQEYANWQTYYPLIANGADIKDGYFFAVTEAKIMEGSAVLRGSNFATPTLPAGSKSVPHGTQEPKSNKSFYFLHL